MRKVGAFEAKTHFSRLLERVEHGEEITITRRGKTVARLVPASDRQDPAAVKQLFRELHDTARSSGQGRFDWDEWKAFVEAGRR